jgi:hypothetical protein
LKTPALKTAESNIAAGKMRRMPAFFMGFWRIMKIVPPTQM